MHPLLITFWQEVGRTLLDAIVAAAAKDNKNQKIKKVKNLSCYFNSLGIVLLFCSGCFFFSLLSPKRLRLVAGRQLHHFLEVVFISKLM